MFVTVINMQSMIYRSKSNEALQTKSRGLTIGGTDEGLCVVRMYGVIYGKLYLLCSN